MIKKNIPTLGLVISFLFLSSCQLFKSSTQDIGQPLDTSLPTSQDSSYTQPMNQSDTTQSNQASSYTLQLQTKYGPVVFELFADKTPQTSQNFLAKVASGFYNNLTFHRVVPGFVVQGGDPTGTGTGGGKIASEINTIPFVRGSLGLARTPDTKDVSNDSQFFICLTDEQCSHLTNEYVNFGRVLSGMEFVDQITQGDLIISITPLTK